MAWESDPSITTEAVFFNGRKYNRYPDARKRCHRVYYTKAGGGLLHRDVWEHHNGEPVPPGCDIHHADGDPDNNSPENLLCIPSEEHRRVHRRSRQEHGRSEGNLKHLEQCRTDAAAWHRSDEGRNWHREVSAQHLVAARAALRKKRQQQAENPVLVNCEECGETFPSATGRAKLCSTACASRKSRRKRRAEKGVAREF